MIDPAKTKLHELLEMCANKARANMGEGRAHVHFQEMLEAAAQFSRAHYEGDAQGMFDASDTVFNAADDFCAAVEEPEGEDDFAEEGRVFRGAQAL